MAGIKNLAKDTAIYGLSSIVGRFLNWMLVPLYTIMFPVAEYGVVTFVYSVVALAMVILTYGMETGFFRFANHERWPDPMEVYSTSLRSLAVSSLAFVVLVAVFIKPVTHWMECDGHPSYVLMMAACVAIDAFMSIPYSYLRFRSRPMRFATLKLVNIGLNIGLNLFFILLCPWLLEHAPATVAWFYDPSFGIGYIFLANLIASAINLVMLVPELRGFRRCFNGRLWKEMLLYSAPLLVLGVAGIMNQTIDKILYPHLVSDPEEAMYGLGIYGANYKIGILLLVFLQAFRFAYEPFIFARSKDKGETRSRAYCDAMKYFVVFALFIFLGVMYYIDVIKYFISPRYFSGLKVVPLIMLGELFFGIFYNLSVWYKLTDRTVWGMYFSLTGLAVTLVLNVLLVPVMGYMGCAVAALCSYGTMMLASYFVGRVKYPIPYETGRICLYFGVAAVLYFAGVEGVARLGVSPWAAAGIRLAMLAAYVLFFMKVEHLSFKALAGPVLNRLHR
ncbi:MAG: oligosaccharide flippase family protein [Muribaculaceae bacterium]|nr:oligosaccharide flippase family protein [Muribaculaceae bacterium]